MQESIVEIEIGATRLQPSVQDCKLLSLGVPVVGGVPLRGAAARFLPWFDSYHGDVFREFRWLGCRRDGARTVLQTCAVSDPDYPFMEQRDSSGDVCLCDRGWDTPPVEARLDIVFEPAGETIDGRRFDGFRYWFEYEGGVPIHRLIDRQTWEVGGNLDDVTVICRNLFDAPCKRVGRDDTFSTVGRTNWSGLLPGNLWARWSLLPAFDMQTGSAGTLVAWFDRVSCIRTAIESRSGEDAVRYVDAHYFAAGTRVATNPKTVLFAAGRLDEAQTLNLWTRIHDREAEKARRQFGIVQEPLPLVQLGLNVWQGIDFATTYEDTIDRAAEFGAELVFIDSVFQNGETVRATMERLLPREQRAGTVLEKVKQGHMCLTLDFEVAETAGGEAGLKALCDRAAAKGVRIMSWMAAHYCPITTMGQSPESRQLGHGTFGIYAAKESGRHPDTGYAADCWTLNLNAPIRDRLREQLLGVCQRTGLAGFLWDSFSNLGWWQVDYSDGSMRPQFDRMAELFADLTNAGLYLQPEAIVSFCSHSGCGLFGGNVYAGDRLGYSYDTVIGLHYADPGGERLDHTAEILRGREPVELLMRCFAHRRVPPLQFATVPREEWDPAAVVQIKALIAGYQAVRARMVRRTVLPDDTGVLWEDADGRQALYAFQAQRWPRPMRDVADGRTGTDLKAWRIYESAD